MKKVLLIMFISISIGAFGQKHFIGVQAGINLTNLTAKDIFNDTKMRAGLIGGVNYELKISEKYQFGIDALYSQQGFIDKMIYVDDYGNETGDNENFKFNYDYISIPIKVGYKIGDIIKVIPGIGLVPSILLKAETIMPGFDSNGNVIGHETVDTKDYVSKFDLGGLVELGLERKLSDNILLCHSLTYKHSLTTFSNSDYFVGGKMRHYGFSISFGLKYGLKIK
jgi:hypothetical protein